MAKDIRGPEPVAAIERLMARIAVTPGPLDTDCWISDYSPNKGGYTRVSMNKTFTYAHRLAYEHFIGPIPDELTLDHLCRVTQCCNPAHLEPVTRGENTLRRTPENICKWGHSLDDAYVAPGSNRRNCRTCKRRRLKAYKQARRSRLTR